MQWHRGAGLVWALPEYALYSTVPYSTVQTGVFRLLSKQKGGGKRLGTVHRAFHRPLSRWTLRDLSEIRISIIVMELKDWTSMYKSGGKLLSSSNDKTTAIRNNKKKNNNNNNNNQPSCTLSIFVIDRLDERKFASSTADVAKGLRQSALCN